eukprot:1145643-Pelagomonas_calceolata.AAC.3
MEGMGLLDVEEAISQRLLSNFPFISSWVLAYSCWIAWDPWALTFQSAEVLASLGRRCLC